MRGKPDYDSGIDSMSDGEEQSPRQPQQRRRKLPDVLTKGSKPTTKEVKAFLEQYNKEFPRNPLSAKQVEAVIELIFDKKFLFGRDRLFQYMKSSDEYKHLKISRRQIMAIIKGLTISQLFHGKRTRTKDVKKTITSAPLKIVQMDLVDMSMIEAQGEDRQAGVGCHQGDGCCLREGQRAVSQAARDQAHPLQGRNPIEPCWSRTTTPPSTATPTRLR
eukprot:TRINITY_DN12247_c1_g3_i3.p1 TRINITY_DN12247_c1_g3~~TRINITY_DN12247_c1_g3_i3.p1  ORF type:complete len:218 (+),score=28.10 TRINITY_DN12247_c1_g3_i3:103-756(+)